eukprot:5867396-Alexandrium_andersonii.AAC.1
MRVRCGAKCMSSAQHIFHRFRGLAQALPSFSRAWRAHRVCLPMARAELGTLSVRLSLSLIHISEPTRLALI